MELIQYIVQFIYEGHLSAPECPEANEACWNADIAAEKALDESGLKWVHEYAYPDGSMYKRVWAASEEEIKEKIVLSAPIYRLDIYVAEPQEPFLLSP